MIVNEAEPTRRIAVLSEKHLSPTEVCVNLQNYEQQHLCVLMLPLHMK